MKTVYSLHSLIGKMQKRETYLGLFFFLLVQLFDRCIVLQLHGVTPSQHSLLGSKQESRQPVPILEHTYKRWIKNGLTCVAWRRMQLAVIVSKLATVDRSTKNPDLRFIMENLVLACNKQSEKLQPAAKENDTNLDSFRVKHVFP